MASTRHSNKKEPMTLIVRSNLGRGKLEAESDGALSPDSRRDSLSRTYPCEKAPM
jgi:hypothetical protein